MWSIRHWGGEALFNRWYNYYLRADCARMDTYIQVNICNSCVAAWSTKNRCCLAAADTPTSRESRGLPLKSGGSSSWPAPPMIRCVVLRRIDMTSRKYVAECCLGLYNSSQSRKRIAHGLSPKIHTKPNEGKRNLNLI